jgi:hypothetical protein
VKKDATKTNEKASEINHPKDIKTKEKGLIFQPFCFLSNQH